MFTHAIPFVISNVKLMAKYRLGSFLKVNSKLMLPFLLVHLFKHKNKNIFGIPTWKIESCHDE